MKFDGIIFDLDGTLWDSTKEVAKTWSMIISKYNLTRKEVTVEDLKPCMGKLLDEIAKILLPDLDEEIQMKIIKECCEFENEYLGEFGATLYNKLEETLENLSKKEIDGLVKSLKLKRLFNEEQSIRLSNAVAMYDIMFGNYELYFDEIKGLKNINKEDLIAVSSKVFHNKCIEIITR